MQDERRRLTLHNRADHADILLISLDYAMLLRAHGHQDKARRLVESTAEAYAHKLGEQHPYTIGARNNRAMLLLDDGETDAARDLAVRSTQELEAAVGRGHVWAVGC